jgi:hypothetical protein
VVDGLERGLEVADADLREEADPPDIHAEHGHVGGERDPGAAQERPVTAEGDDEVEVTGPLGLLVRAAARRVVVPDVDVHPADIVVVAPTADLLGRLHRGRSAAVLDDADAVQRAVAAGHARVPVRAASRGAAAVRRLTRSGCQTRVTPQVLPGTG